MALGRHPKKEVQQSLEEILADGWWRLEEGGHWGLLYCGQRDRSGCRISVHGTPSDPSWHAKDIEREARKCRHR